VPATAIARRLIGRPLPNTALLGGFSALTSVIGIDAVVDAILQRFPGDIGTANAEAARAAHAHVLHEQELLDA
jgi:pyruvate ferredoxin oxidoreductase gamma subunit